MIRLITHSRLSDTPTACFTCDRRACTLPASAGAVKDLVSRLHSLESATACRPCRRRRCRRWWRHRSSLLLPGMMAAKHVPCEKQEAMG